MGLQLVPCVEKLHRGESACSEPVQGHSGWRVQGCEEKEKGSCELEGVLQRCVLHYLVRALKPGLREHLRHNQQRQYEIAKVVGRHVREPRKSICRSISRTGQARQEEERLAEVLVHKWQLEHRIHLDEKDRQVNEETIDQRVQERLIRVNLALLSLLFEDLCYLTVLCIDERLNRLRGL